MPHRCFVFDATLKSFADRFQKSIAYLQSASSMLFWSVFRAACVSFLSGSKHLLGEIDCPLRYFKWTQEFWWWNRFLFFCSKTFSELLVWDRWFTSVSGEAVIFWTRVPKIHSMKIMKLIDCPPCGFDAAFLFLWNQVPKPIVWDKSSTCLSNNGSPMLSLFKLVGSAACLKSTAHFCVIWRRPQVSCRQPPFWKKQVPKLVPKSCVDRMPKSTPVASLLHVMFY